MGTSLTVTAAAAANPAPPIANAWLPRTAPRVFAWAGFAQCHLAPTKLRTEKSSTLTVAATAESAAAAKFALSPKTARRESVKTVFAQTLLAKITRKMLARQTSTAGAQIVRPAEPANAAMSQAIAKATSAKEVAAWRQAVKTDKRTETSPTKIAEAFATRASMALLAECRPTA